MFHIEIMFVLGCIAALVVVLSIVLMFLMIRRVLEQKNEEKMRGFMTNHSSEFFNYLMKGEPLSEEMIPTSVWKIRAIEEVFNRYLKSIHSEEMQSRITQFVELHMLSYYRRRLRSRKWSHRMNTLHYIHDFKIGALLEDVEKMLRSSKQYSKEEYFQMIKVLMVLSDSNALKYLQEKQVEYTQLEYRKLLFEISEEKIANLLPSFDQLSPELQLSVIDVIGMRKLEPFLPFLEEKIKSDDREIRLAILKAMTHFSYIPNFQQYLYFVESDYWEERMLMARLFVQVNRSEAEPFLRQLIQDPSWWVRSQAARSLISLKNGSKLLESIISYSEDRYAIDMAREVLRKV
ncbi:HEAT repeat domain-containing protein [Caldalkalibacillus mannanilyticus]|uniref:HEAT repeat domain-containing protein n=1 Tax=Caldalkalibacillus mannanilyticus TaxID=1418 RepID=UPI000469618C|nr:HEAT repeat domain-containing protein [Caldalkalibacillus mannanilyticus]